jgi:hypothetical protein
MRSPKIAFVVLLSFLVSGATLAQSAAAPPAPGFALVSVTTLTVRPSAVTEFEEYIKKINAAAVKTGLQPASVYSVGRGGPGFTYVATVRYAKWADLDARPPVPAMLNKAYGEAEGTKISRAGSATIESLSSVVLRALPGLSSPPPSLDTPSAHVRVSRVEIQQGMGAKLESYLAMLKGAQDKIGGTPPVVRSVVVLGHQNVYMAAYFFDNYAQWDSAPTLGDVLKKAFGESEAALAEEMSRNIIKGIEVWTLDYRKDLSRP